MPPVRRVQAVDVRLHKLVERQDGAEAAEDASSRRKQSTRRVAFSMSAAATTRWMVHCEGSWRWRLSETMLPSTPAKLPESLEYAT
mmetsp:Transcript_76360/g.236466  ORF Transcript_76360/g.236466 Transcript_76360/m.236466 type:complete len:86 (-) Transcript_76360:222-479(-)